MSQAIKKASFVVPNKEKQRRKFQMSTHYFTIKPMEFHLFIGMDVDKRSISITVLTHEQEVLHRKLPYNASNLLNFIGKRFPEKRIVFCYEAGPTGYGLYDKITEAGHTCLVVPPAGVPKAPSDRVKTNRVDSRKLAVSLRGGELHGIHVPSLAYRYLRYLVQLREVLLCQVVSYKNRIKGLLLMEGICFPESTVRSQWTNLAVQKLKTLDVPAVVRLKLDHLLQQLEFSRVQLQKATIDVQDFCIHDAELSKSIHLLGTIPGIGMIVGMHLLARIGDWRFLQNPHQIAGLLGLIPSEDSTGNVTNRGSITRLGDSTARNKLIETAWTAVRTDRELREFFLRVCSRHPKHLAKRKAIVAVARKLTVLIYIVLLHRRPYLSQTEFQTLQERPVAEQNAG
jgi:transposase